MIGTTTWSERAERVLAGEPVTREEALAVLRAPDTDVLSILDAAWRIRRAHFGNEVRLNYLVNAKSGACPEDCAYCSQSKVSKAAIERYPRLTEAEILERVDRGVALGATTCCLVMSGHRPSRADLEAVAAATARAKAAHPGLKICACLGTLDEADARYLADAGIDRYNVNLNTSEQNYERICSTHDFAERLAAARDARRGGLSLCSGLIVGMGETDEEIVDVAFELRETGAHSVPVNFLVAIPGTPLEGTDPGLDPRKCLKILAMVRFVCPDLEIRVSAGRETHLRTLQPLALYPANSLFVADYLTTAGQAPSLDHAMIEDLGFVRAALPGEE